MIEFSNKHPATDEKGWRVSVRFMCEHSDFDHSFEDLEIVTSRDVNMGGVLDFIDKWAADRMEKPDSGLVEYEVTSIRRVNTCPCCGKEIPLDNIYCQRHVEMIAEMLGAWDSLVDGE